jgi:hypothetical protein
MMNDNDEVIGSEEPKAPEGTAPEPGVSERAQDESSAHREPSATESEREAGAWDDVAHALNDLGQAVTAWAGAFRDDPETRRHASELKSGFERMGRQMGDALDSVAGSDFGRSVASAANKAGAAMNDAARRAGDQVSPFVVTTLRGAADGIQRAADRLERRAEEVGARAAEGEPEPTPEAPEVPEPPDAPAAPPVTPDESPGAQDDEAS